MRVQEIADLTASCLDLSPSVRPTARAVFERVRDVMARCHAPVHVRMHGHADPPGGMHGNASSRPGVHNTSLQAELQRRNSMREALKNL